jgi:uncharacterized protein with von Willebrand factor type A (vWA) domain
VPETPRHRDQLGGIIHTYQRYDPQRFPAPGMPPPEVASAAFEHMLMYGEMRHFTEEELANAVRIDPSQIRGLGPSIDALIAMLEERKRKILATYETERVVELARKEYLERASDMHPPENLAKRFHKEVAAEHLRGLEQLWYRAGDEQSPFARALLNLMERLAEKYEVDELAAKYDFTGRTELSIERAIEVKEELEAIDRLLEQLKQARETAQIGVIDMEELSEFASQAEVDALRGLEQHVRDYLREMAEAQGLEQTREGYRLTPQAFRVFQSKLLAEIFSELAPSRSGRHDGPIIGEGAIEIPATKAYEFGDSPTHMDVPQTLINAMTREWTKGLRDRGTEGHEAPRPSPRLRVRPEDIEIHRTRNTPKCATSIILDMSGSMRYDGQYIHCKRMAIALDGLIRSEYPGDYLSFIEMYTFAKMRHVSELPGLMPKPVTMYNPVIRLRADMSDPNISEFDIPPHFTNIQRALQLARQLLSAQDTTNRQIILITDGLPTAHFEGEQLFLLYPPDDRTEQATMREAILAKQENITLNVFLLPSWSQSHEDVQFAHKMAETTGGRVFFTAGKDLDRYVVWDYVTRRRKIIGGA